MATRDRTPTFNQLREENKNRRPRRVGFAPDYDTHDNNIPLVSLNKGINSNNVGSGPNLKPLNVLPQWMSRINDIDANFSKITFKIEELGKLHSKNVLPSFDGEDKSDQERDISILTSDISRLCHGSHQMIKALGSGASLSPEDIKMKENIQTSKYSKLQELSQLFKQKQRIYLTNLQKLHSNSFNDWGDGNQEEEDERYKIEEFDHFTDKQMELVKIMEQEAAERNTEIKKILASINDLTTLYQDISVLIVQQGTLLDRIDYNLTRVEENLEEAEKEVGVANKYHKEYRTRLCILMILVALVIGMVFFMIIKAII
eukprot:gene4266-5338_t